MVYTQDLIQAVDISWIAPNGRVILRDINFILKDIQGRGQITAIVGPSGTGKTTLFKIMAGLLEPTTGHILAHQEGDGMQLVTSHIMGVVAQNYPLFKHLTVMDNMLRVCKDKAKIAELMNKFGVMNLAGSYPRFISGGQRQRCAIIQQILCSGKYFLMDEPFSGLDIIAKCSVCGLIREVASHNEENSIFIITHGLEDALKVADRIIMLGREEGKEGSTIRYDLNLIERGLSMDCCPKKSGQYMSLISELEEKFRTL